jgi:hypothetical protein
MAPDHRYAGMTYAVCLSYRFPLSIWDNVILRAERGVQVTYDSIRQRLD